MPRRTLIVMVKEPRPGRVKTRLGAEIGMVRAAWWYRHQCRALLNRLRDPRWHLVLAVSPDREGLQSRVWPGDLPRWPQGSGRLGDRMRRLLASADGPAVLIGSDIPGVTRAQIARAFATLGGHDLVFGPATDGGYWLVGTAHPRLAGRGLFQGVRWSGPHALADSIASAAPWRTALVDHLHDVDVAGDLGTASPP